MGRRGRASGGAGERARRAAAAVALLAALGCGPQVRDVERIEAAGTLVALLPYNATSYFLYRGALMGYEFELLRAFADHLGLELEVRRVADAAAALDGVARGEGDVAGGRLLPDHADRPELAFTRGLYRTRLALVQRAGPGAEAIPGTDAEGEDVPVRLVRDLADLAGRTVHVAEDSAALDRLLELAEQMSGDVEIVEVGDGVSAETLIRRVAAGEIELTAAQRNLARLKRSYFTNIAVRPALGPAHPVAWAVHRDAPELRAALDAWIADPSQADLFEELYYKYFVDRRGYRERVASRYLTSETGRLSPFDAAIREEARRLGWDWRLLASVVYQESRFDPRARSWAGARGLMQLMPVTAEAFGVTEPLEPRASLRGGVDFLRWLLDYWDDRVPDPAQRVRFALASYNVGQGHVDDARRLAQKHGDDPDRWADVARWLVQKSRRPVYTDPVVEHGYCRGLEPVTYVARVLERYAHYRAFVPEEPVPAEPAEPEEPVPAEGEGPAGARIRPGAGAGPAVLASAP